MQPFYTLTLAGLMLAACTVDGSVIDDLPCECAVGFMCDQATNRCVPAAQSGEDAGRDSSGDDAALPMLDVGPGDSGNPDTGNLDDAGPDTGPDSGPDTGPVRDPDLGDCIAGAADTFEVIDSERWGSVTDSVGVQTIEDGEFVTSVPANNPSSYSFLFARERVDLSDCATLIEMPAADSGDESVSFFSMRINNDDGALGFGVVRGEIRADYDDGTETTIVWTVDYNPAEHRWFAFRGVAGEVAWLVSADGRDWMEVGRVSAPIPLDALQPLFGIGANGDNATDIEARFDNYNNPL